MFLDVLFFDLYYCFSVVSAGYTYWYFGDYYMCIYENPCDQNVEVLELVFICNIYPFCGNCGHFCCWVQCVDRKTCARTDFLCADVSEGQYAETERALLAKLWLVWIPSDSSRPCCLDLSRTCEVNRSKAPAIDWWVVNIMLMLYCCISDLCSESC